jgi:hypothetical protein
MSDVNGGSMSRDGFYGLGFAGQMIVWALRKRLQALAGDTDDSCVAHVFRLAALDGLYEALASIADIVACGPSRKIQLHAVSCPCLAPHEIVLLEALAELQGAEPERAYVAMSDFMGLPAARLVWPAMHAIVDELDARALRLVPVELCAAVRLPGKGPRDVVH